MTRELRTQIVPRFTLESGEVLADVRQAYHLDGELTSARDNLVIVFHALTGSADAAGWWWRDVIGPGQAIDTRRWAVLAPNLLGSCYGSTGPSSLPDGARFPLVTTRDQARLVRLLVDELDVRSVALATGGSLGGMVALEWVATFPHLTRGAVVFAAPAAHTAYAIGWNQIQRAALDLDPERGLAIARMIGMMTYRTEQELGDRFARRLEDGELAVRRYLERQGEKLLARFDAASYRALIDAMDAHDIGRGRGGTEAALRALAGDITAVGIPGDLLYGAGEVAQWAALARARYREIQSTRGHDAFLLELDQVGDILRDALRSVDSRRRAALDALARSAALTSTRQTA